ncbi:MAG: acetyl-CoA carboxylase biotin carboxylase subunit [Gammaproteobacteria bacterium]|jgi:3-methylcrotonyl-CoA carboxylase alpha subunit|nr:acetyl-CoA carboxylase biotin carboxylase subunit [Gammaproteobacteria bacterium]
MTKIKTVLIANRGEIACRIIRTLKRLGIKAIAVYAEPDKNALHCHLADEAYCIGPIPVEKSYLNTTNILHIAKKANADAIHPGYGFLSENAAFAKLCTDNNLIFIGPSSDAISKMAVKDEAKKIMANANVPTVPGYEGDNQSIEALSKAAQKMGYPVILKAARGGGGKGMRVVTKHDDLNDAIMAAKRESKAAFGDDSIFIEKYLQAARHIEVQIFRDHFGNTVHLFERDCSLQRRHQKIIEESPACHIPEDTKQKMYQAAINAAHAIDYVGAGTIEFLYTKENQFYFMEMNTRLQVEHPVTEMVTGFDLVEWQILVANKEALPQKQENICLNGHAFEARIYAEDPFHQFLPATGTIVEMMLPLDCEYRLDTGIQISDKIGIYFDPLLAKLIVHGSNRFEALQALQHVLNQYHLVGIVTNLPFLRNILQNDAFQAGNVHTQYVESNLQALLPKPSQPSPQHIAIACLVILLNRRLHSPIGQDEKNSPWNQTNAWRLNLPYVETIKLQCQQEEIEAYITHPQQNEEYYHIVCKDKQLDILINGKIEANKIVIFFHTHQVSVDFAQVDDWIEIFDQGQAFIFKRITYSGADSTSLLSGDSALLAPMPGIISKIWVKSGENVHKGTKLLALEAMKMEHTLSAPKDGAVKSIYYKIGDQVEEGCELIEFE